MSRWFRVASSAAVLITSLAIGCGPRRPAAYPTRGRVLFSDGLPVRSGSVELLSSEHGLTATGRIAEDGSFVLGTYRRDDGAAAGTHRAIVVQMLFGDGITAHSRDHGRAVQPRFGRFESSALTATIEKKSLNEIELTVEPVIRNDQAAPQAVE